MSTDKQPKLAEMAQEVPAREAWRVFGIMAEFVEATERLVGIHPAVSVFGSARVQPGTPYYEMGRAVGHKLVERYSDIRMIRAVIVAVERTLNHGLSLRPRDSARTADLRAAGLGS